MVLDLTEMDFNLKVKWWVRPRQLDGSTVEDYYTQFCNWRQEMVRLSIPAEEEDYVEQFILNLRWEIRYRLFRYESWSRLIDVYHDAKFEESMMIIEENLKQIKAHKVFDEMSHPENGENGELHGAEVVGDENGDEILVQIEDDSEDDVSPDAEDNKSTGLEFLLMNTHPYDTIEDVAARECEQNVQKIDALILTDGTYAARFEEETNDMEVVFGENILERGACNVFDETFKSIPPSLQSSFEICSSVGVYSTHSMSRYVWEDASIPLKTEKLLINGLGKYHTSHNRGPGVVLLLFDKMPQVTFVWSFEDIVGAKCYVPLIDWVPMVFDPGNGIEMPIQNHAIFYNDGADCNEQSTDTTAEEMAEHEAFISTIPMAGISAASTYAIRFEGATYVITRATSEKNVMVYDAFDGMIQSKQMDVTRVHRGMISSHDNHSSFLVGNEWCSTDLNSHSKNNLVYTNLWKCENVYSLNDILVLVFDPGGCSFLCMEDCRLLEYNEEQGDFHFTTNANALEYFHCTFDGDSAGHFSKGISVSRLAIGIHSMALSWVVFAAQFCEQRQASIILRNSQQALFHNMDECTDVVPGLPIQRVPYNFALLPLAYTMHIKYTLLGRNILGYQNAAIQRITHKIFHLLDDFKHSQMFIQIFCVVELLFVGLNKDGLHSSIHAFRAMSTVQQVQGRYTNIRNITGAFIVILIIHFSENIGVTKFGPNVKDSSAGKEMGEFGSNITRIGSDMLMAKTFKLGLLLSGFKECAQYMNSNDSDGVTIVRFHVFIWDPGENVNSLYILEDKDVVERVGKDIVLMDTTLVIRRYDHEVQMRCLDMMDIVSCWYLQECVVTDANCKHVMLQVEQFAQGFDIVPLLNEKDRDMGLIYNMQRASTLLHTLTLSCKLGGSALIIHRGVEMINPSFIVVVENFVWDPGLILVYFRISTLRTRWLLRGRICHELTFYYKFYMYFRIYVFRGFDVV